MQTWLRRWSSEVIKAVFEEKLSLFLWITVFQQFGGGVRGLCIKTQRLT